MVIGTNNFIETLPLNDCQPRLKSNLTTHEMEVILRQLSNWYIKRTIRLDTHILSCFHRLSLKMGFFIHSHDMKMNSRGRSFYRQIFLQKLVWHTKRKVIVGIIKDILKAFGNLKNKQKGGWSDVFLINRNFENVRYFNKLFIFFLNLFIFLID